MWGNDSSGAALGADQTVVKLRQAYTDWTVPDMPLRVRMGIQNINLPKKLAVAWSWTIWMLRP